MLQNATLLRKSEPWPPNISDERVSRTAPATENASLQILFNSPTPAIVFEAATKPSRLLTFDKAHNPLRLPRKTASECPKVLRAQQFFPRLTSQLPKVLRTWGVFSFLTCKCASRHNGVQCFHLSSSQMAPHRRCSEPTFRPAGATNHWKNTVLRDFPTFSRTPASSFWLFPFSDLLSSSLSCLTLTTSAFPSVHIVGSLTSKLPSFIYIYIIYLYLSIFIYLFIYLFICIYLYLYLFVCVYLYLYLYLYLYSLVMYLLIFYIYLFNLIYWFIIDLYTNGIRIHIYICVCGWYIWMHCFSDGATCFIVIIIIINIIIELVGATPSRAPSYSTSQGSHWRTSKKSWGVVIHADLVWVP